MSCFIGQLWPITPATYRRSTFSFIIGGIYFPRRWSDLSLNPILVEPSIMDGAETASRSPPRRPVKLRQACTAGTRPDRLQMYAAKPWMVLSPWGRAAWWVSWSSTHEYDRTGDGHSGPSSTAPGPSTYRPRRPPSAPPNQDTYGCHWPSAVTSATVNNPLLPWLGSCLFLLAFCLLCLACACFCLHLLTSACLCLFCPCCL